MESVKLRKVVDGGDKAGAAESGTAATALAVPAMVMEKQEFGGVRIDMLSAVLSAAARSRVRIVLPGQAVSAQSV